jgi:hypothetical protein
MKWNFNVHKSYLTQAADLVVSMAALQPEAEPSACDPLVHKLTIITL